jgi:hypothetical protein
VDGEARRERVRYRQLDVVVSFKGVTPWEEGLLSLRR